MTSELLNLRSTTLSIRNVTSPTPNLSAIDDSDSLVILLPKIFPVGQCDYNFVYLHHTTRIHKDSETEWKLQQITVKMCNLMILC